MHPVIIGVGFKLINTTTFKIVQIEFVVSLVYKKVFLELNLELSCCQDLLFLSSKMVPLSSFRFDRWVNGCLPIYLWSEAFRFAHHPIGTIRDLLPIFLSTLSIADPLLNVFLITLEPPTNNKDTKLWRLIPSEGFLNLSMVFSMMAALGC